MTRHHPVRTVICLTSFDPGGTERQTIELVRRLDRSRFEVHVACLRRRGAWLSRVSGSAASLVEFPLRGFARPHALGTALAFARWCRRIGADVVHASDFYTNTLCLPAAALARVPLRIGSRRGMNHDRTAPQRALQRFAYRCAHRVVANSGAAAAWLVDEGVPPTRVVKIPNGLDLDRFGQARGSGGAPRVVTVANLRPGKGHADLIAAAAIVVRERPDARFHWVGDGPLRAELERAIAARGLTSHIELLGHQDDVPALLGGADAFVLPSWSEAFPNSVLEAMAAGLPVVATAVDGILEIIETGINGVLVPPRSPSALAEALLRLLAQPEEARRLGAAARQDVRARYSFDRMVAAFEALYTSAPADVTASAAVPARAATAPGPETGV